MPQASEGRVKPVYRTHKLGERKDSTRKPKAIKQAKALRRDLTKAERKLWYDALANKNLGGYKFRKQQPIGDYIVDFICMDQQLIIELDGGQHNEEACNKKDAERTEYLESQGYQVIRFWNNDVLQNLEGVGIAILEALNTLPSGASPPLPSRLREGQMDASTLATHSATKDNDTQLSSVILLEYMDLTQDLCNAALGVRSKRNIRVRQPLNLLTIVSDKNPNLGNFGDIIKDEVNVKNITWEKDVSKYATLKLRVNSKVLGKRLLAEMKKVLPASKQGDWKKLSNGNVECAGVELLDGEFDILLEPNKDVAERAQALSTNDALVILDTTITPELEAEGYARDLVRMIQQARKDAGLHISDRIELAISGEAPLVQAATAYKTYITEQTLSNDIVNEIVKDDWYKVEQSVDDKPVVIGLRKVA